MSFLNRRPLKCYHTSSLEECQSETDDFDEVNTVFIQIDTGCNINIFVGE